MKLCDCNLPTSYCKVCDKYYEDKNKVLGGVMPIINTGTGKILVTDEQLIKDAKEFFAGITDEELSTEILKSSKEAK